MNGGLHEENAQVQSVLAEIALLTTEEVAHIAGVTPDVVKRWRRIGKGPAYVKLGKRVAYRRADVVAWVNGCVTMPRASLETTHDQEKAA